MDVQKAYSRKVRQESVKKKKVVKPEENCIWVQRKHKQFIEFYLKANHFRWNSVTTFDNICLSYREINVLQRNIFQLPQFSDIINYDVCPVLNSLNCKSAVPTLCVSTNDVISR